MAKNSRGYGDGGRLLFGGRLRFGGGRDRSGGRSDSGDGTGEKLVGKRGNSSQKPLIEVGRSNNTGNDNKGDRNDPKVAADSDEKQDTATPKSHNGNPGCGEGEKMIACKSNWQEKKGGR